MVAGSGVNAAAPSFLLIEEADGPYRDFSRAADGSTCRWGDQFAGSTSTSTAQANWRTRIAAIQP